MMNKLQEMVISKYSSEAFENRLKELGFQFVKDKEPWVHNENCFVYHYSCSDWENIDLLQFLRENKI